MRRAKRVSSPHPRDSTPHHYASRSIFPLPPPSTHARSTNPPVAACRTHRGPPAAAVSRKAAAARRWPTLPPPPPPPARSPAPGRCTLLWTRPGTVTGQPNALLQPCQHGRRQQRTYREVRGRGRPTARAVKQAKHTPDSSPACPSSGSLRARRLLSAPAVPAPPSPPVPAV